MRFSEHQIDAFRQRYRAAQAATANALIARPDHGKQGGCGFEENEIVSWRDVLRARVAAATLLSLAAWGLPGEVQAQSKLDARYQVTLAGIPIGKGGWIVDITESQFTAAASGGTAGLLSVFAGGQGASASHGSVSGGKFIPGSFGSTLTSDNRTREVRMTMAGGDIKEVEVTPSDPPEPPNSERVPVTEAHRRGVFDPLSASLVRMAGSGSPLTSKVCDRTAPIFDGHLRFDLKFAFKRMDQVKSEKGYEGPVVVCAVYFVPVAGYIPTRTSIKYLTSLRDMEMWFAPIGSSRVLVPYRISIPTPIGNGVLQATQFVAQSPAPQAAANPKTQ
jgi:hypothetical protein